MTLPILGDHEVTDAALLRGPGQPRRASHLQGAERLPVRFDMHTAAAGLHRECGLQRCAARVFRRR
jgi:hypothetical protein